MGKESRLKRRYQPGETRQQYANGDRKLYDRNAAPAGTDEEVWHLARYFSEKAENNGWSVEGLPIVYTELYHRISSDKDLTSVLSPATMGGKGGLPPVTGGTDGISVVEEMIDYYYNNYYSNKPPSVNNFCSYDNFNNIKDTVIKNHHIKSLYTSGIRKVLPEPEITPSRRDQDTQKTLNITLGSYTEEELKNKMRKFKEGT